MMQSHLRTKCVYLIFLLTIPAAWSCSSSSESENPHLYIIIAVDQFRAGYLARYDQAFEGGFRRLMNEGLWYEKAVVDHAPTLSWPGHTTIATGAHPKTHGISTNAFIVNKTQRKMIFYDANERILGFPEALSLSPRNTKVTGIADWFRSSDPETRTVALSTGSMALCYGGRPYKDRSQNHVYWLDPSAGQFVTTAFYRDTYPDWVDQFNSEIVPEYKKKLIWENSVPQEFRHLARKDDTPYEADGIHTAFPHRLADMTKKINPKAINYWFANYNPHANEALFGLAREAIKELDLGQREAKDFLAIGIKSTDRIGHDYGPCSLEQLDNILRIDRELEKFFGFLDKVVGKDNYALVLTADHGAPNIVEHELAEGHPARRVSEKDIASLLSRIKEVIQNYSGPEAELPDLIAQELEKSEFVARAMTQEELSGTGPEDRILHSYRNSHVPGNTTTFPLWTNRILSGIVSPYHPGNYGIIVEFIENGQLYTARSAHASSYWYDQEVPILFWGKGIARGVAGEPARTVDIAPTMANLAGVSFPDTVDGKILKIR